MQAASATEEKTCCFHQIPSAHENTLRSFLSLLLKRSTLSYEFGSDDVFLQSAVLQRAGESERRAEALSSFTLPSVGMSRSVFPLPPQHTCFDMQAVFTPLVAVGNM